MNDNEIDALLEPILAAAGTSLKDVNLYHPRAAMREAMRAALARPLTERLSKKIVSISIDTMKESCERTTFFVKLTTDEGFSITPSCFATGSTYKEGLSIETARDRALIEAHVWGDFLLIPVTPYIEDGIEYKPSMLLESHTIQRELAVRDAGFM